MTRQTCVYLAGPISADNVIDVLRNIGTGIDMGLVLFELGYAPFTPHLDYHFAMTNRRGHRELTVPEFYKYSMSWLRKSDAVVVMSDWEGSKGTAAEIAEAERLGIPVYYWPHLPPVETEEGEQ